MKKLIETDIQELSELGNVVPEGYTYYEKKAEPADFLILPKVCFKWYNLFPPKLKITNEQVFEVREFITSEINSGKLFFEKELGFIILHRAGDYLLLLITTWRNTNEMWESVYYKKADSSENYQRMKFKNDHRGTYCVWELEIVWHERNSWLKFIKSKRDEAAKLQYLNNLFKGVI